MLDCAPLDIIDAETALLQNHTAHSQSKWPKQWGGMRKKKAYNCMQYWQGNAQAPTQHTWYAMSKKGKSCFSFMSLEISFHCSNVGSTPEASSNSS